MIKVGAITIGQSPRVDVTGDVFPLLGNEVELLQAGGLDGLSREEIETFAPGPDDYVLISRLQDGSSVIFAERFILPRLQNCIDSLEEQGVQAILFLCTGDFPAVFRSKVPLIFPCKVLNGMVPALASRGKIAVITPTPQQLEQSETKWKQYVNEITAISASPYGEQEELDQAARKVAEMDVDLAVLDCIGYSVEMKKRFCDISGKPAILSRTLAVRALMELLS